MADPKLTAGEITKLAWLTARMAKRGIADDRQNGGRIDQSDLQRKFDRVLEGARKREEQQSKRK
ncbi:DUF6257 family protein [Streptomyces sp. AVP053U2]|uniref:DUF6257 family protein n=1 Tax=Streptomyces sp. AVP053U2 TaxID=1737066 RepID=UPI00073C5089|nr:DUF6257 family protein [Streptomyces sp. AVP053U2]ODA75563.1 hypothetical protein APS67_000126 [Streptomyces sp. AVP053U2]